MHFCWLFLWRLRRCRKTMTTRTPELPDPITLAAAIAAAVGVNMTAGMTTWSLLILASLAGAGMSLVADPQADKRGIVRSVAYVIAYTVLASALGGLLTVLLAKITGYDWRWIVIPAIAFVLIAGPMWFAVIAKRRISKLLTGETSPMPLEGDKP